MNETTTAVPLDAVVELVAQVFRGPAGLLIQLVTIGYIFAAFLLYGLRNRFFHPDVINAYGAAAGAVVWALLQGWIAARHEVQTDAIPVLGPLLAVPAIGSIVGRAQWLIVARRNEHRRESITKWEYKTRASAATLVVICIGAGMIVAPFPTVATIAMLVIGQRLPAGARVVLRLLGASPELAARGSKDVHDPQSRVIAPVARAPELQGSELAGYVNREGELVVDPGTAGSRYDAADATAALIEAVSSLGGDAQGLKRVRVGVAERVNPEASGRGVAVNAALLARIRVAAESVAGVVEVGEPVLDYAADRGWRVVIAVAANRLEADETLEACASAVQAALPELAAILVCREIELGGRR